MFPRWAAKFIKPISKLKYDKRLTPISKVLPEGELNLTSEQSVRDYFDKKGTEFIEGIWDYTSDDGMSYRLAIIKNKYKFIGTVIGNSGKFRSGEFKASFETAASNEVLTVNWLMSDKKNKKLIGIVKNKFLLEINGSYIYKTYPKSVGDNENILKKGEWSGNGSGIIISKIGYIVTNHHVIVDSNEIEVEFILNDEVQKFNAEVIQIDKTNDLAIIKIVDANFDGVNDLPYNFKTRSSDVGTKVYAFGYPMALSVMGKEIKITVGIISSKSGYYGDITTYQISAAIQGGNSGGPLFDDKGNFLRINSSGLGADVANNIGYTIKSSYVLNLIDVIPKTIELPSSKKLQSLPLTEQIKEISKYVVLVKVK